jgi:hypothetical protein
MITDLNKSFVLFAALYLSFASLSLAAQTNAHLLVPKTEVVTKTEAATIPSRQSVITMKDIGASRPIELRGVNGNAYLSPNLHAIPRTVANSLSPQDIPER